MSPDRPLVILAGPIHADGHANLESGARVVVCTDETEAGLVTMAAEAQGTAENVVLFTVDDT